MAYPEPMPHGHPLARPFKPFGAEDAHVSQDLDKPCLCASVCPLLLVVRIVCFLRENLFRVTGLHARIRLWCLLPLLALKTPTSTYVTLGVFFFPLVAALSWRKVYFAERRDVILRR